MMDNAEQPLAQVRELLAVYGLKVIAALGQLGIQTTSFIAIIGAGRSPATTGASIAMPPRRWKKRPDDAGIGIPYPQRDVDVYEHKAA